MPCGKKRKKRDKRWSGRIKRVMKQKVHLTSRKRSFFGLAYEFKCGVKKGFYTFEPRKVTCKRCKKVMRANTRARKK